MKHSILSRRRWSVGGRSSLAGDRSRTPEPYKGTPPSQARVVLHIIVILLAVAAGFWTLYKLERVVFLLMLSLFFAYLVAPLVRVAARPVRIRGVERRLPTGVAIGLVYLCLFGVASAGAGILLPRVTQQISDAASQAPAYAASIRGWEQWWTRYQRANVPVEVRQGVKRSVARAGDAALEYGRGLLMGTLGALTNVPWLVLIPILAFFLVKDASQFRRAAIKTLPHRFRLRGRRLFDELNTTLAAYVRAQLVACMLIGSICGVGFALLGVPYPALLGVLAGALEFIPLVGPLLCAVVATIVAALHAPVLALWVVGFLASLRMLQDYVIYPRLVGRGLHLHPLAIVLAVLAGVEIDGVAGMFVAVPVVAIGSVLYRHWLEWRAMDGASGGTLPVEPPLGATTWTSRP
jgi:predicted PurR-regulated permease PerM